MGVGFEFKFGSFTVSGLGFGDHPPDPLPWEFCKGRGEFF
jgi:hypothetical protein